MLRNEINDALVIFNEFGITEDRQRNLFNNGIHFDFTYGDPDPFHRNKKLGVLEFATLLKTCKYYGISIDANEIVDHPYDSSYEELVKMVYDENNKYKIKVKKVGG